MIPIIDDISSTPHTITVNFKYWQTPLLLWQPKVLISKLIFSRNIMCFPITCTILGKFCQMVPFLRKKSLALQICLMKHETTTNVFIILAAIKQAKFPISKLCIVRISLFCYVNLLPSLTNMVTSLYQYAGNFWEQGHT